MEKEIITKEERKRRIKKKISDTLFVIKKYWINRWRNPVCQIISIICIYLQFLALEFGNVTVFRGIIPVSMDRHEIILNLIIVTFITAVLNVIIGIPYVSTAFCIIFFSALGIANHYVIKMHGMPLNFQELQNFKTALNVIGGVGITLDPTVSKILGILFIGLFMALAKFFVLRGHTQSWGEGLWIRAVYLILSFSLVDIMLLSPTSNKPESILAWSWKEVYPKYGYALCSLESYQNLHNVVVRPDGYSIPDIPSLHISTWYTDERPDIILILNETFYDFNVVTRLQTDEEFLPHINRMENLKIGHVVVPNYGGGTNATEYELLTGNSNRLINNAAPFNVMDMTESLSIVSVMKDLGYETTGMHSEAGSNYSRSRGYSELGFDNIYFEGDFQDLDYYGKRAYETDSSLYKNLIKRYESSLSAQENEYKPQFMYLLTIQNHGGWNQNPDGNDIIHTLTDYGEYTDDMNEFLSCMQKSDEAFYELAEYFKNVDRPVVICMLGDHCPNFADGIADSDMSPDVQELNLRRTPFIMWSNRELPESWTDTIETVSTNYIVPLILDDLELPRPAYYQYMEQIADKYPVLGANMKYMDGDGVIHTYDDSAQEVTGYFYMEYNNIVDKAARIPDLYTTPEYE